MEEIVQKQETHESDMEQLVKRFETVHREIYKTDVYQPTEKTDDFKIKALRLQIENDDLKSKLTLGQIELESTIQRQKLKIDSLEEMLRL